MLPKIIGILGRSRAGKDSVADLICNICPEYHIQRLSYPLKRAVCCLYGYSMDQLENNTKEMVDPRWNKTPRETIQSLTDYMMGYMGKTFFTRRLFDMYDQGIIPPHMIIPDIRYEHDIYEIQKRGGIIIKVERPENNVSHSFERHIDFLVGNHRIINDGSMDQLHEKIKAFLEKEYSIKS